MRRNVLLRLFLAAAVLCILLPAAVLVLWSAAARWSWPSLLPERWSARTVRELLFGSQDLWRLLGSSMSLGSGAAGLSTLIGLLTGSLGAKFGARASAGLARNLRQTMYENIQSNIKLETNPKSISG